MPSPHTRLRRTLSTVVVLAASLAAFGSMAADGQSWWRTTPVQPSPKNDDIGTCTEVPAALQSQSNLSSQEPLLIIGRRAFYCTCGGRALVGGTEGRRLVGGAEGAKLVGGAEGAKLVGGDEGAKLVGGDEGRKLVGGAEGSRLVGGTEGTNVVGAGEGAKLVGTSEGAKLVGAAENAKLVGAETQLSCRLEPGCAGYRLVGLSDGIEVRVQVDGRMSRATVTCVTW